HHDRVEDVAAGLDKLDAHGAMVALHGDVVALDLFEHRDTFKRAWPSLLRGYAMDAVLEGQKPSKPMTRAAARRRLRALTEKAILRRIRWRGWDSTTRFRARGSRAGSPRTVVGGCTWPCSRPAATGGIDGSRGQRGEPVAGRP